jgi:hypothetical protein
VPQAANDEKGSLTMAAPKRLLTEKTDPATTADLILYALGEVFEKQFYPNDREQCQEVAREIRQRAGLPVPPGVVLPRGKAG